MFWMRKKQRKVIYQNHQNMCSKTFCSTKFSTYENRSFCLVKSLEKIPLNDNSLSKV